jgi:hypothetical protein
MSGEQALDVGDRRDRHALAADLAARQRVVGIEAHERRHVERRRQARLPVRQQIAKAAVRVLGRAEAGNIRIVQGLPRYIVSCGPARERELARAPSLSRRPVGAEVGGCVDGGQRQAGLRFDGGRIFAVIPMVLRSNDMKRGAWSVPVRGT